MNVSVCLVVSLMKSSRHQPPPMAVCRGPHIPKCTTSSGSVAREVVFGVRVFRAKLHLMQLLQSHLPVMFEELAFTFRRISKYFRPMSAKQRCRNIRFSASCRDASPVFPSATRQLLLSISGYSDNSGAQS